MTPVVAIVQARMGSTRFPGKMMADFLGYPMMQWVLERTRRAHRVDQIILATTDLGRDDPLAALATEMGIAVYRGDEDDVLGRFVAAADMVNAATVVRICADRPLIAPEMIDLAIDTYGRQKPDYAFNHIPGGGQHPPIGLGAEVLSAAMLGKLDDLSSEPQQREHVTYYIWDHPQEFSVVAAECPPSVDTGDREIHFVVDTKEDLAALSADFPAIDFGVGSSDLVAARLGQNA